MPETLTIHFAGPVRAVGLADARDPSAPVAAAEPEIRTSKSEIRNLEGQAQELAQLCRTVGSIAGKLKGLYEETIGRSRGDIARLAVEIARKILMHKTSEGDYSIQAIVEEALKRAPTRQNIVIRLNPQDLAACQKLQLDDPDGPLAHLEFVPDFELARADCLVETPKGIIKSFVEEHLERIGEALRQVE